LSSRGRPRSSADGAEGPAVSFAFEAQSTALLAELCGISPHPLPTYISHSEERFPLREAKSGDEESAFFLKQYVNCRFLAALGMTIKGRLCFASSPLVGSGAEPLIALPFNHPANVPLGHRPFTNNRPILTAQRHNRRRQRHARFSAIQNQRQPVAQLLHQRCRIRA
jgi:hypothetical protein